MKREITTLIATALFTLVLTACGGGGGSTPPDSTRTQEPNPITTALDKVKAVIASEAGATISYTELNSIPGVEGAVPGKDYVSALTAGTYADRANPTADEIQAVIDSVNIPVAVNHLPQISGTPTTAVQIDNLYSFTPTASDSDGDPLSFSIVNKPIWASFDTQTGTLRGTPGNADVGTTQGIVISVSDGTVSVSLPAFDITVKRTNHAPTITGTPGTALDADTAYSFTPTASDSDGDTLVFGIVNKPAWATFDEATGRLSGTPSNAHAGTTSGIVISVNDGTVTVGLAAFDVLVHYVNHAPTLEGTPATAIQADSTYSFIPTASDIDTTDTLVFAIVNKPTWATFDTTTGKLSGTPSNADVGTTHGIVISLSDGTKSVALPAFDLTVKLTNHTPTIAGTPVTTVNAESSYTFTPTASDSDADTLTFSIVNKPTWASFDTATGTLSGIPANTDAGTMQGIVISVSDGTDSVSLPAFNLTVIYLNHTPSIMGTPITTVNADSSYSFTPTANDSDGDPLTFSIVNKPTWTSFDTHTGTLSGTPTNANEGMTSGIVISVRDNKGSEVSLPAFDLTVKHVNHAPSISGTPLTSIDAGSSYSFKPAADDIDADTLTFSIVNKPTWASFDTYTGTLRGTPSNTDAGTTQGIVISVNDGTESVELPGFAIQVNFHIETCVDTQGDKGYTRALEIASGKIITKIGTTSTIRLWHTSDGKRKVCVVTGKVSVSN